MLPKLSLKLGRPSIQNQVLLALTAVQVLFGINYVTTKVVIGKFPPLLWASLRSVVAGILLLGIALLTKRKPPAWNKSFFYPLIVFSLFGVVINQTSFLMGLYYTTATNSSILTTLIPVFTLLFVTLMGKEKLTWNRALGFFLAFVGVLSIRGVENFSLSDKTFVGDCLTILNCISYGLFLALGKSFIESHDAIWTTACMFVTGSFLITLMAVPEWMAFEWPVIDLRLFSLMAFAIVGGTLMAYLLNVWALARTKSSSVALFIYLQPAITSALAWHYFGEAITLKTVVASLCIFIGMVLALGSRKREPKATS